MKNSKIYDIHQKLINKEITCVELIKKAQQNYSKYKKCNHIALELFDIATKTAQILDQNIQDNILFGVPYSAKDNFTTKNINTSAGSNILKDFKPCYSADVINILNQNNSLLFAKNTLDELGMGGHGLYSNNGWTLNPFNNKRITGGSSSGSAVAVATDLVKFSLGTDTGDSIRKPAAYCGIVGFKPSYGVISRYGVIPYAPSLDTVGFFTSRVADSAILLDNLAIKTNKDFSQPTFQKYNTFKNLTDNVSNYKCAFIKNVYENMNPDIKKHYDDLFAKLKTLNINIDMIDMDQKLLDAISIIYIVISFAESISTHSNLDGINFGNKIDAQNYKDIMIKTRSEGFGNVVQRRFLIGSYSLAKENQTLLFLKAKKVRRLINNMLKDIYKKYNILILPPADSIAPLISDVLKNDVNKANINFIEDVMILSNLYGNPSITIPLNYVDNMPIGINLNSDIFKEQEVLNFAYFLENIIKFKNKLLEEDNNE